MHLVKILTMVPCLSSGTGKTFRAEQVEKSPYALLSKGSWTSKPSTGKTQVVMVALETLHG